VISTACGSIPSLLPSNTVSTAYPPSYRTMDRPATAAVAEPEQGTPGEKKRVNKPRIGEGNDDATCRQLPVLVAADLSDHSCLATADAVVDRSLPAIPATRRGIIKLNQRRKRSEPDGGAAKGAHLRGTRTRRTRVGRRRRTGARRPGAPLALAPPWPPLLAFSASGLTEQEPRGEKGRSLQGQEQRAEVPVRRLW